MGETQYVCNNDNRIMFDTEDSEYGCLCTFPHNYEVSGKKLNKWTIASLALLGAGIAISANKASSMIGSDDKYIDSYYLPNCIPQWIRDEFDRILELSKEEPDIITEEEYTMKEQMRVHYDGEGDFLEISIGDTKKGVFRNLGKGIFERVDKKTGDVLGLAIHSFSKKANLKSLEIPSKFGVALPQ